MTPSTLPFSPGLPLQLAGFLMILLNIFLSPQLPVAASFVDLVASDVFAWRQTLAVAVVLAAALGAVLLYVARAGELGGHGAATALLAFTGSAFMLAHEWNQVFFVRDLALLLPESLVALEDSPGMTLFDWSALIAVVSFTLGWIGFAVSLWVAGAGRSRWPIMLIAAFFMIPLLALVLPGSWGQSAGGVVLGVAWYMLGRDVNQPGT